MRTVFFILIALLFLGANFYVIYRLVNILPANMVARSAVAVVCGVAVLGFFVYFLGRDIFPRGMLSFVYTVSSSWIFIFLYFLIIFLVLDIFRVTHLLPVGGVLYKSWTGFFSVTGLVAVIFAFGHFRYLDKERVELDIALEKPSAGRESLKIVAISDLHLGDNIDREEFTGWVELINKEEPDILLIAGDMVDHDIRALYNQGMADVFGQIKTKYGIYAILGNHEYIAGAQASEEFLKKAGINLLKDSFELIGDSFYVVGRDDRSNPGRMSVAKLTASLDRSKPIIMLDHQPFALDEVSHSGVDLQISGHTHYGQVWPVSWITKAIYELPHGYMKKENTHFYVSSGIGLWGGKFRIGTQSEYVVINLSV